MAKYRTIPVIAGAIAVTQGMLLFVGMQYNLTVFISIVKGPAGMNPLTAICFIASGLALIIYFKFILSGKHNKTFAEILFYSLSSFVILTAFLRLVEYAIGIPVSLAHLISEDWVQNNTMAPNTAFNFIMAGVSLIILRVKNSYNITISQSAAILTGFIALLTIIGYLYSIFSFNLLNVYLPPMALNTAIIFIILATGILFIKPDKSFMSYITSGTTIGNTSRKMMLAAIIGPIILGWLRLYGEEKGLYDATAGTALFVWVMICVFFTIVIFSLRRLLIEDAAIKLAERKIAESELRFRAIVDNSPVSITMKDLNGRYIMVNKEVERIIGKTIEELKGKTVFDLHPYQDANIVNEHDKTIRETAQAMEYEETVTLNGKTHTFLSQKFPLYDINNNIYATCGISTDITQRKQMEERLRENNEQIETIFENAPNAVVVINEQGTIIRWNSEANSVFGWKAEEVYGKPMHEIIMPHNYREAHIKGLNRFLETGKATIINKSLELSALRKNGEEFPIELRISDTILGGKHIFIAFINDITERKLAEKLIAESEIRLRAIIDNSPVVITMKDMEGRFIMVNKEAERILGRSLDVLKGKTVYDFYPYEGANIVNENDKAVRETGRLMEYEEKVLVDGDEHTFLSLKFPLRDIDNNIYATCGISTDITDRKKSEENLYLLNSKLSESNKELESFSYSVSHDLRAPLRHIIGFGAKLNKITSGKIDAEGERLLGKITSSADKMAALIDDLLMFSRVGRTELNKKKVKMRRLVNEVIGEYSGAESFTNIEWKIEELPDVMADPVQIKLVIENLVSNAVKYTAKKPKRIIEIGSFKDVNENVFYVRDNGTGFERKYSDKLFGVFQRLHNDKEYEGTGIGLATVRRIITHHGGKTWAEGETGKGASFYFTLPE
jgi:PAS domain S-box-containing protein